jgi:hypothetical protein
MGTCACRGGLLASRHNAAGIHAIPNPPSLPPTVTASSTQVFNRKRVKLRKRDYVFCLKANKYNMEMLHIG